MGMKNAHQCGFCESIESINIKNNSFIYQLDSILASMTFEKQQSTLQNIHKQSPLKNC